MDSETNLDLRNATALTIIFTILYATRIFSSHRSEAKLQRRATTIPAHQSLNTPIYNLFKRVPR
jgi:hypothetical protein